MQGPASSSTQSLGSAAAFAIVSQLCGAAFLYLILRVEGGWQVAGLLALLGAGFYVLEKQPWIADYAMTSFARVPLVAMVTAAAIVVLFPFAVGSNTYVLHLLIVAQLYAVLALALNFQLGSANIPNFATGASYGIGAYVSALLAVNFGVSFWLTLPIAALAATLFGFIIGIPSMRTRDTYLALVTIAFGVVVQQLLNNFEWTGGPNGLVGIPAPSLFGHSFADPLVVFSHKLPSQANFYYLSALLVVVAIVTAHRLHGSRIGLAWNALRADEIAARAQGINVAWYKVLAFAVDAFLAAFAGTIYAFYISYISPDNFTFLVSVTIMTMVIVGGMDNIFGVIVGAFLLTILPEKLRAFSDYRLLFFGVVIIGFLMIRPQGLFPQRMRRYGGNQ
ncbi:branched-chain amino acid ABC transporter permease [Mesorhizobium sp. INR15]|uniref:branched-chain amino acid ABC transporter permease n=1 Tax=Mesorhizobium sp. INR15 TaxID=2654248 RepID=UPI00189697CD|nr:branched-chain amino acid ABC transporter permease [Mesorhizobium sp. INR15]QPC94669.1 branched-chain amino acid ABC transporter permease [Mesorhizobium sp. INR15]